MSDYYFGVFIHITCSTQKFSFSWSMLGLLSWVCVGSRCVTEFFVGWHPVPSWTFVLAWNGRNYCTDLFGDNCSLTLNGRNHSANKLDLIASSMITLGAPSSVTRLLRYYHLDRCWRFSNQWRSVSIKIYETNGCQSGQGSKYPRAGMNRWLYRLTREVIIPFMKTGWIRLVSIALEVLASVIFHELPSVHEGVCLRTKPVSVPDGIVLTKFSLWGKS